MNNTKDIIYREPVPEDAQKIVDFYIYERFGFEIEGRLKNTRLLNGVYYDLYVMGLML